MATLTTNDSVTIAFDRTGDGPAVVLLHGGPFTRMINAGLANALAPHFTVFTFDPRGRGDSGGDVADTAEHAYDDLGAALDEAGGEAHLYGSSGAGIIALHAAARGLPITKLAVWEPPYSVIPGAPKPPATWGYEVAALIKADRRGDAVAYWMTAVTGTPPEVVEGMRQATFWAAMEAEAHGLVADYALVGDFSFPVVELKKISVPTLVLDGGATSYLAAASAEVVQTVPGSQHRALDGQPHNVDDAVMANALIEFFS